MHTNATHQNSDFFRYTSGRWLWDEEEQLLDRYKVFDVPELQRVAAESVGASACVSMIKLGEGSYNKVFRLIMDNDLAIIVRIPHPNAGPRSRTTASEVATMDFARTILQIPVPKVLAWNIRADNSVGSEYIIMEEANGTSLDSCWHGMELKNKSTVVEDLVSIEKKLSSISFTRYGSIYYADDGFEGCEKAEVIGDVPDALRKEVEVRFVIGPIVEREFWSKERSVMDVDRGPWNSPQDYVCAIARREISWISKYAVTKHSRDALSTPAAQDSPESHICLLQKLLKVAPFLLPNDAGLVSSRLWHKDMHIGNLFVNNDRITSVIDWQSTWVGPMIIQARQPRLLHHKGDVLLSLPDNYKELETDERDRLKEQVSASILLFVYETQTARQNPLLSRLYRLKHGQTRIQPILFAGDTWMDDIIPFRESLINLEKFWKEFDVNVPCPIHFTPEELQSHARDGEGWNEKQDFWDSVAGLITRDGWTSHDTYSEACNFVSDLERDSFNFMTEEERAKLEART